MLQKAYPRKVEKKQVRKLGYIPHHRVTHSAKQGKVKAVFDCSTEFGMTSLNKPFIAEPDLPNLLISVSTGFREKHISYTADIKAMFHKMKVPENQESLLRFLLWEHGDSRKEIEEFEMCGHLFGSKSSQSCSSCSTR